MTEQQMRETVAELDGYELIQATDGAWEVWKNGKSIYADADPNANFIPQHILPDYTNSSDAIISVIKKQDRATRANIMLFVRNMVCAAPEVHSPFNDYFILTVTAKQLCEALLKSVGKWIE